MGDQLSVALSNDRVMLMRGKSEEVLRQLVPECIDAVVCDPPYGLSKDPDAAEVLRHWLAGDDFQNSGGGFMGKTWDSFVPGPNVWREVYRLLKPGGYLLAFAGTRTMDLMSMAIRLAGFEIRDTLSWMYGTGFPKSMDVSKAIDKAAGVQRTPCSDYAPDTLNPEEADRDVCTTCFFRREDHAVGDHVGTVNFGMKNRCGKCGKPYFSGNPCVCPKPGAVSPEAQQWEGWGTALKPAWEPIIMARKPLIGTVAQNVLTHGTGALNIDATRIGVVGESLGGGAEKRTTSAQKGNEGWTRPWMEDEEQQEAHAARVRANVAKAESLGRWPANLLFAHHEDCVPTGLAVVAGDSRAGQQGALGDRPSGFANVGASSGSELPNALVYGGEEVETFDCHEDCPVRMLDEQAGDRSSPWIGNGKQRGNKGGKMFGGATGQSVNTKPEYKDAGSASRFFYRAKAAKSERNRGLPEGVTNDHPTVKPVEVMRWLVRMVTPPGGLVLDHYCGSGTTGVAAVMEGFSFVGIDRDDEGTYLPVAKHRIESVL